MQSNMTNKREKQCDSSNITASRRFPARAAQMHIHVLLVRTYNKVHVVQRMQQRYMCSGKLVAWYRLDLIAAFIIASIRSVIKPGQFSASHCRPGAAYNYESGTL